MRKRATVIALLVLSGLALLFFVTVPGAAQSGWGASIQHKTTAEAERAKQWDLPHVASTDTTIVFQEGISPTVSYDGVADTYIFIDTPMATPGGETLLRLYYDHRQKALLRFELADHIPVSAVVTAVRFELRTFQRRPPGPPEQTDVGLYEVLRPWTEDGASWNDAALGERWQVAGCGPGTDRASEYVALTSLQYESTWYAWESAQFTALVQSWVSDPTSNHGMILIGLSPEDRQWWSLFSSQYGTLPDDRVWRPKLTVSYHLPPPTATPTRSRTPSPVPTPSPTATEAGSEGSVAGMVWQDVNQNGARDLDELPMPGVPAVLSRYADNQEVARHVTAADGSYEFTSVAPDNYLLTTGSLPGYSCTFPLGCAWVFPLSAGQRLAGLDFGIYRLPTITPTRTPEPTATDTGTPTSTPTRTLTPIHTATGVPSWTPAHTATRTATLAATVTQMATTTSTPMETPTGMSTPTVTSTNTRAPTLTAVSSPTPTGTTGPPPTPTTTPAGTLGDPIAAFCEWSYNGNTAGHPATIQDYGGCLSGLLGPEVVYALEVAYPMDYLSVSLDTAADLTLLVLASPDPDDCRSWGGIVGLPAVSPGTYYIVVDGFGAGAYELEVRCFPPPEATPTPTVTPGPSAIPTSTRLPGEVTLYVPLIRHGYPVEFFVNCGADVAYADSFGRHWLADQVYVAGSWGHVGDPVVWGTKRAIQGADDQKVYQTLRFGNGGSFGYRFDVPNGTYEVELRFAEIYSPIAEPGGRVFDVWLEEQTVLDNFDVVGQAQGQFRALVRSFTAEVSDGQLNIAFVRDWVDGVDNPIVNAIRVVKID